MCPRLPSPLLHPPAGFEKFEGVDLGGVDFAAYAAQHGVVGNTAHGFVSIWVASLPPRCQGGGVNFTAHGPWGWVTPHHPGGLSGLAVVWEAIISRFYEGEGLLGSPLGLLPLSGAGGGG